MTIDLTIVTFSLSAIHGLILISTLILDLGGALGLLSSLSLAIALGRTLARTLGLGSSGANLSSILVIITALLLGFLGLGSCFLARGLLVDATLRGFVAAGGGAGATVCDLLAADL